MLISQWRLAGGVEKRFHALPALQNKLCLSLASLLLLCPRSGCSSLLRGPVHTGNCSAGYVFVSVKCNSSVQMAWFRIRLVVPGPSLF